LRALVGGAAFDAAFPAPAASPCLSAPSLPPPPATSQQPKSAHCVRDRSELNRPPAAKQKVELTRRKEKAVCAARCSKGKFLPRVPRGRGVAAVAHTAALCSQKQSAKQEAVPPATPSSCALCFATKHGALFLALL